MSTDFSTPPQQERRGYPPLSALRRSRDDRKVVGVSGGLGRWAGVDPLVFRILFVVLTVFGGSGILLYALGWLLIPDDGETESEGQRLLSGRSRSSAATIVGIVVVLVIGIAATGWMFDSGPGFGGLAALVAVVAIVVLISRNHRGPRPVAPTFPDPQVRTPGEPGAYGQTPGTAYSAPAGYPAPAAYAAPAPSYAPTAPAAAAAPRTALPDVRPTATAGAPEGAVRPRTGHPQRRSDRRGHPDRLERRHRLRRPGAGGARLGPGRGGSRPGRRCLRRPRPRPGGRRRPADGALLGGCVLRRPPARWCGRTRLVADHGGRAAHAVPAGCWRDRPST